MPTRKHLMDVARIVEMRREVDEEIGEKVALMLKVDASLKAALQEAYGRTLSKKFEEAMVERLERDGFLKTKKM